MKSKQGQIFHQNPSCYGKLCYLCFLLLSFVLFCLLWLEFVFCLFSFAAFVLLCLLWLIFSFTSSNGFQIKNIFTFFNLQNILYLSNSKKGFVLSISSCVCLKSFVTFSCLNKRNCLRKTFEFECFMFKGDISIFHV